MDDRIQAIMTMVEMVDAHIYECDVYHHNVESKKSLDAWEQWKKEHNFA